MYIFLFIINAYVECASELKVTFPDQTSISLQPSVYNLCDTLSAKTRMVHNPFEYQLSNNDQLQNPQLFFEQLKILAASLTKFEKTYGPRPVYKIKAFADLFTTIKIYQWCKKTYNQPLQNTNLNNFILNAQYFCLQPQILNVIHQFSNMIKQPIEHIDLFDKHLGHVIAELDLLIKGQYESIHQYQTDDFKRILSCIEYVGTDTLPEATIIEIANSAYFLDPTIHHNFNNTFFTYVTSVTQLLKQKKVTIAKTYPNPDDKQYHVHISPQASPYVFAIGDLSSITTANGIHLRLMLPGHKIAHLNEQMIQQLKPFCEKNYLTLIPTNNPLTRQSIEYLNEHRFLASRWDLFKEIFFGIFRIITLLSTLILPLGFCSGLILLSTIYHIKEHSFASLIISLILLTGIFKFLKWIITNEIAYWGLLKDRFTSRKAQFLNYKLTIHF